MSDGFTRSPGAEDVVDPAATRPIVVRICGIHNDAFDTQNREHCKKRVHAGDERALSHLHGTQAIDPPPASDVGTKVSQKFVRQRA